MKRLKIDKQKLRGAIWGKRAKVASFLGIHPNSLSRKINGKQPLTIEELNDIASVLSQDTIEFLQEEKEEIISSVSDFLQERFDFLAEKNTEGTLTESEQEEYTKLVGELEELMLENAEKMARKRA